MRRLILLTALLAVLVAACQVRIGVDTRIDRDASGTFELAVGVDGELARDLRDAGIDLTAGIEELRESSSDWAVEEEETDDGGFEVRVRAPFDDASDFAAVTADVHAPLDAEDMRLFDDLAIRRLEGGAVAFTGVVGFQPPTAPGAEGAGVTFDADDLRRLLEERGDELVRYDVRVTLPAPPAEHDADETDGATLVWHAPLADTRTISAVSQKPTQIFMTLAIVAGVAVILGFVATLTILHLRGVPIVGDRRRRRRRRPSEASERQR